MNSQRPDQDTQAVSSVIGTILMVGMTVVLASVLYVWAMSFTQYMEEPPRYSANAKRTSDDNYLIEVISASSKEEVGDFHWYLKDSTGRTVAHGNLTYEGDDNSTVRVNTGNHLGDGDSFLLDPSTLNQTSFNGYRFDVKHKPSGEMVIKAWLQD